MHGILQVKNFKSVTADIGTGSSEKPSSDVAIIDVAAEPPRQSKHGKSKEPRTHAIESASLKDSMGSLENVVSRVEHHCFVPS